MTRPNRDLEQAGWALTNVVAISLTSALEHIQRELLVLDGFSSGGPEVVVSASADLTGPERHADARWQMTNAREDLRDAKAAVLVSIRELNELCTDVMRLRQPKTVVKPKDKSGLCASGQAGKHAAVEWGDALCLEQGDPARGGLCHAHYWKWYRARKRDGVDTAKDFQPL